MANSLAHTKWVCKYPIVFADLIFSGAFLVDTAPPEIGIVGGGVAAFPAWKKMPVMVCVFAAVLSDFLLYLFI